VTSFLTCSCLDPNFPLESFRSTFTFVTFIGIQKTFLCHHIFQVLICLPILSPSNANSFYSSLNHFYSAMLHPLIY
jgi:hypothetical protein